MRMTQPDCLQFRPGKGRRKQMLPAATGELGTDIPLYQVKGPNLVVQRALAIERNVIPTPYRANDVLAGGVWPVQRFGRTLLNQPPSAGALESLRSVLPESWHNGPTAVAGSRRTTLRAASASGLCAVGTQLPCAGCRSCRFQSRTVG